MTHKLRFVRKSTDGNPWGLYHVDFADEFESQDPKTRASVEHEIVNVLMPRMQEYKDGRGEDYVAREKNPVTDSFFAQSPVIDRWQQMMPTAAALYPLQKPEAKTLADGTPFDEVAERYFPHALDGVGIRSRAAIMQQLMYDYFIDYEGADGIIEWASLACGAAIPVYDAARGLLDEGKSVRLYLADIDNEALGFAKKLAEEDYGFPSEILRTEKRNILRLNKLVRDLGPHSFDAIDILGFFEYIPADDWQYKKYGVRKKMPGASKFLKSAYELLRPGGMLVLGNMRESHPQLQFTTEIIRWPYIRPRSLERVTEIIVGAGVKAENITYYQAGDGVYTVAAITK